MEVVHFHPYTVKVLISFCNNRDNILAIALLPSLAPFKTMAIILWLFFSSCTAVITWMEWNYTVEIYCCIKKEFRTLVSP